MLGRDVASEPITPVMFGPKTGTVVSVKWDAARQCADIEFTDECGKALKTTAPSMARGEIRRSVAEALLYECLRS